jgi:ribonuclease P protein component
MIAATCRLRKHADYQQVYQASRKQFGKHMSYFFALRPSPASNATAVPSVNLGGPRVGLTVSKATVGNAVDRNRIKRRVREAVRHQLSLLRAPVDVVLHPRSSVLDLDFTMLEREVASAFRAIQKAAQRQMAPAPSIVD